MNILEIIFLPATFIVTVGLAIYTVLRDKRKDHKERELRDKPLDLKIMGIGKTQIFKRGMVIVIHAYNPSTSSRCICHIRTIPEDGFEIIEATNKAEVGIEPDGMEIRFLEDPHTILKFAFEDVFWENKPFSTPVTIQAGESKEVRILREFRSVPKIGGKRIAFHIETLDKNDIVIGKIPYYLPHHANWSK